MKVRWKGETDFLVLTKDKVYDVLSVEKGWYRVVDDSGEDYLYPPEKFEIVDDNIEPADTNEWQLPDILKKAKNMDRYESDEDYALGADDAMDEFDW